MEDSLTINLVKLEIFSMKIASYGNRIQIFFPKHFLIHCYLFKIVLLTDTGQLSSGTSRRSTRP